MKEVWKDIRGLYPYQISSMGRVLNTKTGVIRKPKTTKKGYKFVSIKYKNYTIHRLVAEAFIPNPENKPQVNHKDTNKENNCISNLEWSTNSENQLHAYKTGLHKNKRSSAINQYDLQNNLIKSWESMIEVERTLKIKYQDICQCCKGKRKTAGGYIWRYKDTNK